MSLMFNEIFIRIANRHAPKITTEDHPEPWWWDEDIIDLILERDEVKRSKTDVQENKERKQLQRVIRALRKQISKRFQHMKNNHFPPESEVPEVPANIFNEFRYYKDESQHVSDEDPLLSGSSESGLKFVPIDDNKVMVLLQSLTQSVTPGTDEIDARLLKIAAPYISAPICHIMNRSIIHGVFPSQWKNSKILLASQSRNDDFRPKHVLPVLSQILEKILVEQMRKHFTNNKLFAQHQKTLHEMTQDLPTEPNNGAEGAQRIQEIKEGLNSFLDTISPEMLIDNLKSNNFSQEAVTMMKSFLSDRRQKVYYNSCPSHWRKLDCGLPQGSCLAYFLFSVYTNDLKHLFNHIFSCYGRQLLHNTSFSLYP